jgi:alanyl-tRNA synthetase
MHSSELRTLYVEFFKEKGHLHLPSAPLIPVDALGVEDRSTLFTSAGMQQFKPYFTGEAIPPSRRITTVQKCVRTGDIDSVGDYSHCTFFEMLGNFSFGDYFKAEVIPWTWEFLVERLKLDPERLCVTVYEEDDEAYDIWHSAVGLPHERIHRLGGDKNYWPANAVTEGPNGPCGPCTEVFYRVAPEDEMTRDPALTPTERFKLDDDAGRWLEVWNNVFTQFNRSEDPDGKPRLEPLPNKNNDTGAGFERIVCVLQGVRSVFDSDLFAPAIRRIEKVSGLKYGGSMDRRDFAFRVVAEHARAAAFCIADGILPLNEGRGYVLRRIIRRAIRFGKNVLGMDAPFLHDIAPITIELMGDVYPELRERQAHILATLRSEEDRFRRTLDQGVQRFFEIVSNLPNGGKGAVISGRDAFMLHDTYGFPLELTDELAREQGMTVDVEGFEAAMEERRRLSQESSGIDRDVFRSIGEALGELQRSGFETQFVGYDRLEADGARVIAIIRDGDLVDFAGPGAEVEVVLDQTPFYAESGGQVGDTGVLLGDDGLHAEVTDTYRAAGVWLHRARIRRGTLSVGASVQAMVDAARRMSVLRNHTATHLLHAALRKVLGAHVHQKGSLVAPDRLRFDFTHTQPVTLEQIRQVEDIVNERVLADEEVVITRDVPLEEARKRGAMALFGEKYGSMVRTVEVPGFSLELCGGTHLSRTSQVGLFKIVSESGIAAGVRRIEAVTGAGAWQYVKQHEDRLRAVAETLGVPERQVEQAAARLVAQRRDLERQVQQLRRNGADTGDVHITQVDGVNVATARAQDAEPETLGALADRIVQQNPSVVAVVGGADGTKALFVAKVSRDLVGKGVHAGNLIREVARIAGGGGGGRPDFARAGGKDPAMVDRALEAAPSLVAAQIGGK